MQQRRGRKYVGLCGIEVNSMMPRISLETKYNKEEFTFSFVTRKH